MGSMNEQDFMEIVNGNNAFTFDLYSQLRQQSGNLFFSPFSISTCLAMAHAGARSRTADQMAKTFHFPFQDNRLHASFKALFESLSSQKQCELHVANSLWVKMGYNLLQEYIKVIEKNYGKSIFEVNLPSVDAARRINGWVADQTRGKIKNIINQLAPLKRFVLVNAIYFKGQWDLEFDEKQTKDDIFTLRTGKEIKVPMMFMLKEFYYTEGPNFQMLGMFYKEKRIAMVILLPRTVADQEEVENNLTREKMEPLFQQLKKQKVKVFVPRFKITEQVNLQEILQRLGMIDAFKEEDADFTGMTKKEDLSIDAIFHKAFVEVNEEGTEAAAVTITGFIGMGLPKKPKPIPVFRADHPFIFFIRDLKTKSILFMGRLEDP